MDCLHEWKVIEQNGRLMRLECNKCPETRDLILNREVVPEIVRALGLEDERRTITLSTGITFGIKPGSPLLYQRLVERLQKEMPEPEVPRIRLETFEHPEGEERDNPDDPDYLAAVQARHQALGDRTLDMVILMSLDVQLPDSDEWLENLRFLGETVGDSRIERTLAYVRMVAIGSVEDIKTIMQATQRTLTVTEEAVEEATKSA